MLLPMYFLIGVWGGPRKEYAAIKFFLYTLLGSVLMLIAILMLYFNSDLRQLPIADRQHRGHRRRRSRSSIEAAQQAEWQTIVSATTPQHTFNILALQQMGQHTNSVHDARSWLGPVAPVVGVPACCSSASPSRCPACRSTPGCPTRTSRRRRRSR